MLEYSHYHHYYCCIISLWISLPSSSFSSSLFFYFILLFFFLLLKALHMSYARANVCIDPWFYVYVATHLYNGGAPTTVTKIQRYMWKITSKTRPTCSQKTIYPYIHMNFTLLRSRSVPRIHVVKKRDDLH